MENKLKLKAENQINNYNKLKRSIDIILSTLGIIILSPVFLIISIIIKLESEGPIIFKQLRAGKDSKPFYIYKFRSMKADAPNLSTNEFEDVNLFITKIGKFIRRTSIDELPQLINILKGDMSIVGPRPVILDEKELILLRKEYNIDSILPGITGLAQINGRDIIGTEEKVKLDYEYLKNKSLNLDVKIVFITIFKVLRKSDIKKEI
ncbi:glycosyl transferase [[Clostridium] sordellii]|uniref:Undecaprenyl-phosphate galactose phosphotransferase n=1 Tax=Paraclostridium sordellii TaxID=1505 RepID=A0ABP1XUM8_PARSO|nr:sugar transferase [Paeniclostridium sordellii]CEJ74919.1 undecaprenyl-phosphate galactose phosphotransferase [[Clostridium] sordellii] [Paeniclostridium sordellii]CEK31318.1 glycosyl transferase [[Clostridium] sordellii] [Paeniclostridium sordellii]CEN70492.1 glycosyl transferase [[Clostridium] sordellii] [Paeniclostridium sordellii]CEN73782.1 glycosyl transferase [[Clostridium] sordellii] [Paeniclostridium sordellii]CEO27198.1 glycosyl transferase [[Clostridium] sordellii] [Paeniclostridiu